MNYSEITVYARNVETADGKKFTAYETTDKHGNKVNIAFALKGMPAIAADNCPCRIKLIEANRDKRKHFPTVRIWKYEVIDDSERTKGEDLSDLFN